MSVNTVTTGASAERHVYNWVIQNFAVVQKDKQLVNLEHFEINTGPESGCHSKWKVGLQVFNDSHIGFYCTLLSVLGNRNNEISVPMGFSIQVRYRDGHTVNKSNQQTLKIGETCKFERVWTFNWPNWTDYLDQSGNLAIALTLTIYVGVDNRERDQSRQKAFESRSKLKLREDLENLLKTGQDSDVKLISSDDKEFSCHKVVLSCRSSYFASLLRSGFSETTSGVVKIDDLCGTTLEVILHYLYTGILLDTWMEPEVTVELTYAAGKYQLVEILEHLDANLGAVECHPGQNNAVALLELASKLSLQNAEKQLLIQIAKLTAKAENADEMLSIVG